MSLLEQDLHKEQVVNSSLESELKHLKECNRKQREELVALKEALQTRSDNQILSDWIIEHQAKLLSQMWRWRCTWFA